MDGSEMNIFIDCGSYMGKSITKFRKMIDYENHKSEWKFFAFEPNPHMDSVIQNVIYSRKAVWIEDCKKEYYLSNKVRKYDGNTLMKNKTTADLNYKKPIIVDCINLSKWILKFSIHDYIVLKLDVEGAEYEILEHLMDTGAISLIDVLYCEFHVKKLKMKPQKHLDVIERLMAIGKTCGIELHGDLMPSGKQFEKIDGYIKLGKRLVKRGR